MFSLVGCCLALFDFLGLATVGLGGAWHHGWEIGPTGLYDLSPLLFCFVFLFGIDGQLAQVSRMGFYFGCRSGWVYEIVGRACGLSLVFPYPSALMPPVLRLCCWSGCVTQAVVRVVCLVFPCGGEVA